MNFFQILIFLGVNITFQDEIFSYEKWCTSSCYGVQSTVCQRGPVHCKVDTYRCGSKALGVVLSDKERKYIIDKHNEYRNKAASGREEKLGYRKVADMTVLSYSMELEFQAQCWANTCTQGHDVCRSSPTWGTCGQNGIMGFTNISHPVTSSVEVWYNEIKFFRGSFEKYIYDEKTAHFSQVIWAKTTHIGCGRTATETKVFFFCNYGPAGNWPGYPIFKSGEPCSQCHDGKTCGSKYKHLCGITLPINSTFKGPFELELSKCCRTISFYELNIIFTINFINIIF